MAYNTAEPRAEYSANAGQTEFDFVFKIFSISDLKVYSTPFGQTANDETDILIENVDYTVSINGDNGGTVTLTNPAGIDDVIVLLRDLPVKRDYEYQQGGDLSSDTLNDDQDYQTYLLADKQRDSDRFLKLPDTAIVASNILPPILPNAYLKWNEDGTQLGYDTAIPDAAILSTDAALIAESYATEPENVFVKTYNNGVPTPTTDYSALHWAAKSEGFAGDSDDSAVESQLSQWLSDAAKLTAQSYATEPENVFVKTYSSDGDGTFTATNTTDHSSLHWAAKSQASSEASAGDVSFDNTGTESVSTNVQDALFEIFGIIPTLNQTGTIIVFGASTAPTGYLKCNGAVISRTTYSALFSIIGTTFGAGDGSTTFALPDLRGYFPRGFDDGRGIDTGRVFGSNQADEFKQHEHNTASDNIRTTQTGGVGLSELGTGVNHPTSSTGGTETRPKNIALLYCIKY